MNEKLKRFSKIDFDNMLSETKIFLMRQERNIKSRDITQTIGLDKYSHGALSKFITYCDESKSNRWSSFKNVQTDPHSFLKGLIISEKRMRTLDNIL